MPRPIKPRKPTTAEVEAVVQKEKTPWFMKVIGFIIVGAGVAMLLTRYLTADGKIEKLGVMEGIIILFPIAFGLVFLFPTTANKIVSGVKKLAPWIKND